MKRVVAAPMIGVGKENGERFSERTMDELRRRLFLFAKKENGFTFEEKSKRIKDVFVILSGSDRIIGTKMAYAILNNGGVGKFLEAKTFEGFLVDRVNKVGKKTETALKELFDYCRGNPVMEEQSSQDDSKS
jgi:hypothetical protein